MDTSVHAFFVPYIYTFLLGRLTEINLFSLRPLKAEWYRRRLGYLGIYFKISLDE